MNFFSFKGLGLFLYPLKSESQGQIYLDIRVRKPSRFPGHPDHYLLKILEYIYIIYKMFTSSTLFKFTKIFHLKEKEVCCIFGVSFQLFMCHCDSVVYHFEKVKKSLIAYM